jgi:hypothetical protein
MGFGSQEAHALDTVPPFYSLLSLTLFNLCFLSEILRVYALLRTFFDHGREADILGWMREPDMQVGKLLKDFCYGNLE